MGSFLELAKKAIEGMQEVPSDADYHASVEARLRAVCRLDYQAGMIPCLQKGDPALYEELTSRLPDFIHKLWAARAPLEEFEHVVNAWLDAHRRACESYRAGMAEPAG